MNIRDLKYLVAAADTEHFGQAAERCHVSQPTLSGQIRKLEETLGLALFERCNRSVVLTEAGREISAQARRILDEVDQLDMLARSRQDPLKGNIRIGLIPTLCAYLLPHVLPLMQQRFPDLHAIVHEETTSRLLERVREHEIDAALVATQHDIDGLSDELLFNEPLWLAVPRSHSVASASSIHPSALADMQLLSLSEGHCLADRVREICPLPSAGGDRQAADLRATSLETLLQLVAAGQGVTLVPGLAVEHSRSATRAVQFVPLESRDGFRQIRLIQRRSGSRRIALQAMATTIREALPNYL